MLKGPEIPMMVLFVSIAVEELRTQFADVRERLDFAERVLARRDDRAAALPKGAAEAR